MPATATSKQWKHKMIIIFDTFVIHMHVCAVYRYKFGTAVVVYVHRHDAIGITKPVRNKRYDQRECGFYWILFRVFHFNLSIYKAKRIRQPVSFRNKSAECDSSSASSSSLHFGFDLRTLVSVCNR